eukprot:gene1369-2642_t
MASLTDIQLSLLAAISKTFQKNSHNTESSIKETDIMNSLIFCLHDNVKLLENAVDVLDCGFVREITCRPSKRSCWKVSGSKGKEYTCLRDYCPCRSFFEQARLHSNDVMCKHLLAMRIAGPLGKLHIEEVSEDVFLAIISGSSDMQGFHG